MNFGFFLKHDPSLGPWHLPWRLKTEGAGRTIAAYRQKSPIFAQGDAADAVLYIQSGQVKLTVISAHGKEAVVTILAARASVSQLPAKLRAAAEAGAIRPLRINVPEAALVDLRRRVVATRWPDRETVTRRARSTGSTFVPYTSDTRRTKCESSARIPTRSQSSPRSSIA